MHRQASLFVRAFLPVLPLAFCHGCGGSAEEVTAPDVTRPPSEMNTNRAPTIVATEVAVAHTGQIYDYQLQASDPDGDALQFTATNLPPWASIDPTSGHISGTPGEADVGVYESITVVVADAAQQIASAPFSITVIGDVGTGVASLQWDRPPTKVDGSPLDDLAGYRILYGRSADDLDHSVFIDDPTRTVYVIDSLASGVWYFAVVAVNAAGLEGPPTTVASKSI
jgi:hypothetical protein